MHAPTRLAATLAAGLALAAPPARADEHSTSLRVRLGVLQPGPRLDDGDRFRAGPGLEVGVARSVAPWLDVEATLGWSGTEAPQRDVLVPPTTPGGPIAFVPYASRLQLVPVTVSARLQLPLGEVRPYLVAGAGLLYARQATTFWTTQGWGSITRAGAGLDWRRGDRVLLGLEGWWGWGRTDMEQVEVSPSVLAAPQVGGLESDGLHLLATAGWRF